MHTGHLIVSTEPWVLTAAPLRASTHVHPQESTSPPPSPPCSYHGDDALIDENIPFRHSGWQEARCRVYRALCETSVSRSRRSAFPRCGRSYWVLASRDDPDLYRTVPETCHDRFCRPCNNDRALRIRRNLATHLTEGTYRFVTLTLKHTPAPLTMQLDHLLHSFRLLRRSKLWKRRVPGGAAFLEITWNPDTRRWHPHLHVIVTGKYIPRHDLSVLWKSITKDSHILDIRFVRDTAAAVNYVAKYATKSLSNTVVNDHSALREAIEALAGRKTIYAFGCWARWKLLGNPDDESWAVLYSADDLRNRAYGGDELCVRILAAVTGRPGQEVHVPRAPPADQ